MTRRPPRNIAASVSARLLNLSRESGEDFQFLLLRYAAERFLYRLGESGHRDRYALKGAMLFALWGGSIYRPTRDLDFTGYGSNETEDVLASLREVCTVAVADDGLAFDAGRLTAEPIRDDAEYNGLRVRFQATLGDARIPMRIDIGFGNVIEPAATEVDYPTLLDGPAPRILAYPHEAVVAEKLHAMVVLGERNSRYKDFYDLHVLARQFPFDGERLARAIAATFEAPPHANRRRAPGRPRAAILCRRCPRRAVARLPHQQRPAQRSGRFRRRRRTAADLSWPGLEHARNGPLVLRHLAAYGTLEGSNEGVR